MTPQLRRAGFAVTLALGSCVLCVLVLRLAGLDAGAALSELVAGAFGDWRRFGVTLVRTSPLLLTGLAVALAFRAGLWNIGAEGQLLVGAVAVGWAATCTCASVPDLYHGNHKNASGSEPGCGLPAESPN